IQFRFQAFGADCRHGNQCCRGCDLHGRRGDRSPSALGRVIGDYCGRSLQATTSRMGKITLPRQFLRNCRRICRRAKVADSTGAELTGSQLLMRTLLLRRLLLREVLGRDETYVGLLLPPSVGAVVANAALPLASRIAVNLNYTLSQTLINSCITQCGIRHVLTSRRIMERFKLQLDADIVFLEEFRERVTLADKLAAFAQSKLPVSWLERRL